MQARFARSVPGLDDDPTIAAAQSERIVSLDFIRGIAVLGILAANIVGFGQPMTAYMYPDAFLTPHGFAEDAMWVAQFILIDGKMRGLFTLLFGAGLYLFMERAWARGAGGALQARRLFWLGVIGLAHFYLLYRGDILFLYALSGFFALAFVRRSARTQLVLGLGGYVVGCLVYGAMTIGMTMIPDRPLPPGSAMSEMQRGLDGQKAAQIASGETEAALISAGDYLGYVTNNLTVHTFDPLVLAAFLILESLPLMLIGMAFYRMRLFATGANRAKLLRWGLAGAIAGTALTVPIALWAYAGGLGYWDTLAAFMGWSMLPRLPVILGLAALLAWLSPLATGWLGKRLRAAGRTAFSNYLGTSMLMVLIFHGWGGGLYGTLMRGELYLVMLFGWAAMLAWPVWWLASYRYGPLEWMWRCLTYGRMLPLRR